MVVDRARPLCRSVHTPERLVADIFDLSAASAYDELEETMFSPKSEISDCHCFMAGFVCKTVSSLNSDSVARARGVRDTSTATGSTFRGVCLFIERRRPRSFVLENVLGSRRNDQDVFVQGGLATLGYVVEVLEMRPTRYGHPQDRPRLYFIGMRLDLLSRGGVAAHTFAEWIVVLECAMSQGHVLFDADTLLLLPETDTWLVAAQAKKRNAVMPLRRKRVLPLKKRPAASVTAVPRWVVRHHESSRQCYQSACPAERLTTFPDYACLPDRCKDMFGISGGSVPHDESLFLEVSQSECKVGRGCVGTITPSGMVWIAKRGRRMRAIEAMAFQGLWLLASIHAEWTERHVQDLAGNAFCTASCLPCQLLVVVLMAWLTRREGVCNEERSSNDIELD